MEGCPVSDDACAPPAPEGDRKRRKHSRSKRRDPSLKAADLAGNMVCIPDFAAVWYAAVLASSDKFQHPCPSYQQACALLGVDGEHADEGVILDPETDNHDEFGDVQDGDVFISDDEDQFKEPSDAAATLSFEELFSD